MLIFLCKSYFLPLLLTPLDWDAQCMVFLFAAYYSLPMVAMSVRLSFIIMSFFIPMRSTHEPALFLPQENCYSWSVVWIPCLYECGLHFLIAKMKISWWTKWINWQLSFLNTTRKSPSRSAKIRPEGIKNTAHDGSHRSAVWFSNIGLIQAMKLSWNMHFELFMEWLRISLHPHTPTP